MKIQIQVDLELMLNGHLIGLTTRDYFGIMVLWITRDSIVIKIELEYLGAERNGWDMMSYTSPRKIKLQIHQREVKFSQMEKEKEHYSVERSPCHRTMHLIPS